MLCDIIDWLADDGDEYKIAVGNDQEDKSHKHPQKVCLIRIELRFSNASEKKIRTMNAIKLHSNALLAK